MKERSTKSHEASRTNTSVLLLLVVVIGAIVIFAGTRISTGTAPSTANPQMPGADARQLWNHITKTNNYLSWKTLPDLPKYIHVKENPHGDWVAVYLNKEAYDSFAYPSRPFQMRYGSIIVKENYSLDPGQVTRQSALVAVPVGLNSVTVMYKIKGYQRTPQENEWYWVMYGCSGRCDGTVATISNQPWLNEQIPVSKDTFAFYKGEVVAGKPWLCVECHQRAGQQDQFAFGDYVWRLKPFVVK